MEQELSGCVFSRPQRIMLLTPDEGLRAMLLSLWEPGEVEWSYYARGRGAIEHLFNEPPDLLIVDNNLADIKGLEVVTIVKSENVYRQLPIILVANEEDIATGEWCGVEIDELLVTPATPVRVKALIHLTLARASRSFDANPLSRLPGNSSIIQRIQEMMDRKEDFALAYADLDYFKSFNDKYGFSRGDEVLMMTARVIVTTIRSFTGVKSFVGHVGGDDFVFILPPDQVEEACRRIVESFDSIVPHFYDEDDRARGSIVSTDREGAIKTFPLMAISIAVVFNEAGRLTHYGQASQTAMSLKKKAKENKKSCYVLDNRNRDAARDKAS
jgi:diguanylate cyclase (GGDEF)-like protein